MTRNLSGNPLKTTAAELELMGMLPTLSYGLWEGDPDQTLGKLEFEPGSTCSLSENWQHLIERYVFAVEHHGSVSAAEMLARVVTHTRALQLKSIVDDPFFPDGVPLPELILDGSHVDPHIIQPTPEDWRIYRERCRLWTAQGMTWGAPLEQCLETAMIWEFG